MLELIEKPVRCLEPPGLIHVRVDHDACQVFDFRDSRVSVDGHETEALKGEVRFENLIATALESISDCLFGPAEVVRVKVAGLIEHFSVAEGNRGA